MLKLALAKILILALHLAPREGPPVTLHVLEDGKYRGTYAAESAEPGHYVLKKTGPDSELPPMEIEASPRYKQFYTVYAHESGESASINLTKALEALKSFSDKPQQDLDGGEGLSVSLARAGSLLLLMAEGEKKTAAKPALDAKPIAAAKPAMDAKPAAKAADKSETGGGQLVIILENAFR